MSLRTAFCLILLLALAALLAAGCGGSAGIGSGKSTLQATLTQSAGVAYMAGGAGPTLGLSAARQTAVGFDNALVGGGTPAPGMSFALQPAGGGATLTATADTEGKIGIGVVDKDDYRITLAGAEGNPEIHLALIDEIVTALRAIVRVDEPTPGAYSVNMQVIGDRNADAYSDDAFRLTITGQTAAGGGQIVLEHGTSTELPEALRGVTEEGTLDAEGNYTLTPVTP